MKDIKQLNDFFNEKEKGVGFRSVELDFIMNSTRRILEGKNLKKKYDLANFYCNWFIHTELRDSPSVYKSLYEISRLMHRAFESEPGAGRTKLDEVAIASVSMMTMRELRQQLKKLYEEVGVNPMMCYSKPAWDGFAVHLVLQLADKILAFPDAVLNQEAMAKKKHKSAWRYFKKILNLPTKQENPVFRMKSMYLTIENKSAILNFSSTTFMTFQVQYLMSEPADMFAKNSAA